jgi:hypothetical protein
MWKHHQSLEESRPRGDESARLTDDEWQKTLCTYECVCSSFPLLLFLLDLLTTRFDLVGLDHQVGGGICYGVDALGKKLCSRQIFVDKCLQFIYNNTETGQDLGDDRRGSRLVWRESYAGIRHVALFQVVW